MAEGAPTTKPSRSFYAYSQGQIHDPLAQVVALSGEVAVLQVIRLAQFTIAYTRGWAADSPHTRMRLEAELERAEQEIAPPREEIRIKDARMAQLPSHRRPYYPSTERMAILRIRSARHWSLEQAAKVFLVTAATIASWLKRVDEQGPQALVQSRERVNKWPDFVRYIVQHLKTLCPTLGKVKIAQILSQAGLHLGVRTVGLILKENVRCPIPDRLAVTSRWMYNQLTVDWSSGDYWAGRPRMPRRQTPAARRAIPLRLRPIADRDAPE